jgi:hypothetical protein
MFSHPDYDGHEALLFSGRPFRGSRVRSGLSAGGSWIRTFGSARDIHGFEASSELEPTDPRRGGSAEQLRPDQPIGSEGGHSRSRRSR